MDFFARSVRCRWRLHARFARNLAVSLLAATFAASFSSIAAEGDDTVLIRRGDAAITRADFDLELQRLPEDARTRLPNSERHVIELLDRLLVARELARKARAQQLDAGMKLEGLSTLEQDKLLAAAWISTVQAAAGREFDAKRDVWLRRARELYTITRAQYAVPETVVATQIFFAADRGGPEEARKRAFDAVAKLEGGADFAALALAVSDEPKLAETRGRMGPVKRDELYPAIASSVFALQRPGEVSAPLETPAGWHLFRLETRAAAHVQPFDEVSATLLADLRAKEIERARQGIYTELRANNQDVTVNEHALRAMKTVTSAAPAGAPATQQPPAPK